MLSENGDGTGFELLFALLLGCPVWRAACICVCICIYICIVSRRTLLFALHLIHLIRPSDAALPIQAC